MKNTYSPTGWEHPVESKPYKIITVESGNTPYDEGPFTLQKEQWEEILELIDNFAETRHTCGHWAYNLKSHEARQKVIDALKGKG